MITAHAALDFCGVSRETVLSRKGEPSGNCTICRHASRYRIEMALVAGVSARAIAQQFSVSPHACRRHLLAHVPDERRAALVAGPLKLRDLADKAAELDLSLIDYLALVRSALLTQFLAATDASDRQGAALLSGRLLECLRIIGTLQGDLRQSTAMITNNIAILNSPLMADLQAMLIRTLQPFPEARAAVLAGLEDLSRRAVPDSPAALLEAPTRAA